MSDSSAPQPIGLDLVAPELYAPMLRRLAWAAIAAGVLVGVVVALVVGVRVGVAIGCVLGVPTAAYALLARRRRLWLTGTVLEARTAVRTRRLDIAAATGVEILVFPGRLSRIALRVTAGGRRQVVPLAMYTDAGGGRELHILGLRRLADALSVVDSAAALSVSGLLVGQLRAEARDAGLTERPLYRAVRLIRTREGIQPVRLTDADIAALATADPGATDTADGSEDPQ
ncbi:hypothetical protein [Nocardia vermiculata]|uniref:Uncharacterized protein n=1 Tax=Nocardia vermiculata TaxID=257274 RepID=A0A846XZ59_9NOCA|nr:hypothetical protein [Nocardia vermiculata]NKY51162.1 hypothetical protein [Nocardia vermiculata]